MSAGHRTITPVTEDTNRMIKLAELRDRIGSGAYRIDPWLVADALLRRVGDDWLGPVPGPRGPQIGCS